MVVHEESGVPTCSAADRQVVPAIACEAHPRGLSLLIPLAL